MSQVLSFAALVRICVFVGFVSVIISVVYHEHNSLNESEIDYYSQIRRNFKSTSMSIKNMFGFGGSSEAQTPSWRNATSVYEFTVKNLDNEDVSLDKYRGKVLLIVNVASKCGLTKANYKELNEIYAKYKTQGLEILAFPCNQFGHQEPGCTVDIKAFMEAHKVKFDVFAKIDVNGDKASPLYKWLREKTDGGSFIGAIFGNWIKWNFTKFLISKDGKPLKRYGPQENPLSFEKDIEKELSA